MAALGKIVRALPNNSALFICDMQSVFVSTAKYGPQIVETTNRLLAAAKALDMPVVVTEHQPPKGEFKWLWIILEFGNIIPEVSTKEFPIFQKTKYSMMVPEVQNHLKTLPDVRNVVLCGMATSCCVKQTAFDLLQEKFNVHLVVDATSDPDMKARMTAIESMRDAGAQVTTTESMILGLVGDASHPNFRTVQKIIWENAPDTGLPTPSP